MHGNPSELELLHAINEAQARFVAQPDSPAPFAAALDALLRFTASQRGVIAEVRHGAEGTRSWRTLAAAQIAERAPAAPLPEASPAALATLGGLEHQLGRVIDCGEIVCSNDLGADPDDGAGAAPGAVPGAAPGAAPIACFLGIPLMIGGEFLGVIGLADRAGGYHGRPAERIKPLIDTCAVLLGAAALRRRKTAVEMPLNTHGAVACSGDQFIQRIADVAPLMAYVFDLRTSSLAFASSGIQGMLGYGERGLEPPQTLVLEDLIHADELPAVRAHLQTLEQSANDVMLEVEYRLRHADGSWRWMLSRNMVFERDERGAVRSIVGAAAEITERRTMETALRQSEARWRTLVAAIPDLILVLDEHGRIADFHAEAPSFLSATPAAFLGQPASDVLPPRFFANVETAREHVLCTGAMASFVCELETPGGAARSYEARVAHHTNGSWLVICRDVTDRIASHAALRRSEERFRALVEGGLDAISILDPHGNILYSSPVNFRLTGWLPEEVDHRDRLEYVHPDDRERLQRAWQELLASPRAVQPRSFRVRHRYGHWIWIEGTVRNMLDHPAVQGIVFNWRDVTERRATEESLREMNVALQHAMPGIAELDTQGRYLRVYPTYAQLLHYEPYELLGRSWEISVLPEDHPAVQVAYHAMLATGKGEAEVRAVRKDGSVFHKQVLMVIKRDEQGRHVGHHCFMRDVTERVAAEERFALQQAELYHAARLSMLGRMVATLSHEIAQPMSAVSNFAAAALSRLEAGDFDAPRAEDVLRQILQQGNRAAEILQRVRDFARKAPSGRNALDLNALVADSLALMAPQFRRDGVRVQLATDERRLELQGDRLQLQQAVVNVLSNAMEAVRDLDAARRSISVRTQMTEDELTIEVEDEGPGLTRSTRERMFEPFFTTKAEGTGIGLDICRTIVESHGGRVEVREKPRQGVILQLCFPRAPQK